MESTVTASTGGSSWENTPVTGFSGILLSILFIYFFFRHLMFVLMVMDVVLGWIRQFRWFPGEGKRLRTFVHWLIALGLLLGYRALAGFAGLL